MELGNGLPWHIFSEIYNTLIIKRKEQPFSGCSFPDESIFLKDVLCRI